MAAGIGASELTFLRLLERTKRLTKENLKQNVWKVNAAIKVLNNLIGQINEENDMLIDYRREVAQLGLLAEAEKQKTTEESIKIVEKIAKTFPELSESQKEPVESIAGLRECQKSIYRSDLRKELLKSRKNEDNFMKNERIEEDLAMDLLKMTKSLKTVMNAANDVIKEDNLRLTKMQHQVDKNKSDLEIESSRLEHHAYKCGFDCMRIFLVVFIFWTFISMVIIMKMFPKRVSS